MRNAEYWAGRAEAVMNAGMADAGEVLTKLNRAYRTAGKAVQAEISALYSRYADKYGLTYAETLKDLAREEFREWRMDLAGYMERIKATGDTELLRELDALSTRSRVTRLQEVETAIKVQASELAARQEELVSSLLHRTYEESYYRSAFNLQKGMGYGRALSLLSPQAVAEAAAYPWSGASFSERIWRNRDKLVNALSDTLTTGLIRGDGVRQLSRSIQEATGAGRYYCERLVRTETARVIEDAALQSYRDCGIEEYEISAALDERTCRVCGGQDGRVYRVEEAQTGLNYPPLHANCRCTTLPVIEGLPEEGGLRAARDGDGGYVLVPENMTYEQWRMLIAGEFHDPYPGERGISVLSKERLLVYDKNGKVILRRDGEQSRVGLSVFEMRKVKGGIASHNHPSGSSFSWQDINMLRRCKLSEVRAVTKEGIYSLRAPIKWPKIIGDTSAIRNAYNEIKAEMVNEIAGLYPQLSATQKRRLLTEEVSKTFASNYGLEYSFERW